MAHIHTSDLPVIDVPRRYAWVVFALTFGLLISDYMSRQVLNAVFPLLKAEWLLSDAQLGSLSGIVALMVGLLTVPLSILADRWGRVKSLTLMALLWSLATLMCALSDSFNQMFAARFFVGIGEAAYGSVGIALVLSVFPPSLRATLTGAFMAGGMLGSVLGITMGGVLAAHFGWRWAFAGMAIFGLVLAVFYPWIVSEKRVAPQAACIRKQRPPLRSVINNRSVLCAYVGSGLQLFVAATLMAWIPSFMNRYYHLDTGEAGMAAGVFVLLSGLGMVICGMLSDRLCQDRPENKIRLAIVYCLLCFTLLCIGFQMEAGIGQLVLVGMGMFLAAGTTGPAGAMVANLTHPAIHGTAFATLTLVNNMLGLAPGPYVTGILADWFGLATALVLMPVMSLLAATAFYLGKKHYLRDAEKVRMTAQVQKDGVVPA